MCLGLAIGYREPKENLTVITCDKCGRTWQVTEESAKHFNENYNGICPNCRSREEKKAVSLIKKKTNFDKLKDLSAWGFAVKIDEIVQGDCDICPFSTMQGDVQECRLIDYRPTTCRRKYQTWLESEAEE